MNGVLNINKPKGISSYGVVAKIKKMLKVKKVGHAGTLDPEATGVLLVCLNKATKIVQFLMPLQKEYRGEMVLGVSTDTGDAQGKIIRKEDNFNVSEAKIREVFKEFLGDIQQIPPMTSALKYKGRRLYELAREGKTILRQARNVQIYKIDVLGYQNSIINFCVVCSKGTYIRSLCCDIGDKLGCGAHLRSLERVRIGSFNVDSSLSLDDFKISNCKKNIDSFLYSLDDALQHLPTVVVNNHGALLILEGKVPDKKQVVSFPRKIKGLCKVHNLNNKLIAIAQVDCNEELKIKLIKVLD